MFLIKTTVQFALAIILDISYIWSYSSKELPGVYKIAAFWAGQEGSFLLWLFVHSFVGVLLCRNKRMSHTSLAIYMVVQSLLVILLLAKSPFAAMTEVYADGMGMNPLLQDPWMAIHPPIIFIGYAVLAVPYAYSLGALLDRDATGWITEARRWGLIAWGFLGAGIFIGGYWAYKVLGWGGYWGWDPVENSSLVPWLLATVFLHLLLMVNRRKAVLSMAHLAILFSFSTVLYGTFLTRSGILGDFSVHSFAGTSIGLVIACVNLIVLLGGLFLLIARVNDFMGGSMYDSFQSREFFVLAGMLSFVFITVIIFVGMSMPLLTQLVGQPAAVDASFYVRTTMPLAILALLLLTAVSLLFYKEYPGRAFMAGGAAAFVFGAAAAFAVSVRGVMPLLLAGAGALAAYVTGRAYLQHRLSLGAFFGHIGLSAGLLAIIFSGTGSQLTSLDLTPGEAQQAFGYAVTYKGAQILPEQKEKYYVFEIDGKEYKALTKLRENGEDAAREPAIVRGLSGDVYIAPSPPNTKKSKEYVLNRAKPVFDDLFAIEYDDITLDTSTLSTTGEMLMSAEVSVTDGQVVEHAVLRMRYDAAGLHSETAPIFEGKYRLRLTGVSEDQKKIRVELLPSENDEAMQPITASVSTKPLIWILWLSTVLVVAGAFAALRSRH